MREPRLIQPLFQKDLESVDYDKMRSYRALILAYDSLWNLLNQPADMRRQDVIANAAAALQTVGMKLEEQFDFHIFDMPTQEVQLAFDPEIIELKK